MRALFIGRFQPFHKGHMDAIKQIEKDCDEIIIVIGSAQYKGTKRNPLSFEKRKEIISDLLSYPIYPLNDINDNAHWVDHVLKQMPSFDVVYSSNPLVIDLFREQGFSVRQLDFNINIAGEKIRELIKNDNPLWKTYLDEKTIKKLDLKAFLK